MALSLYIIAGEISGDELGAPLIAALKPSQLHGIGGEKMQTQGLTSLFPMRELSLMGVFTVLAQLPHLLKRINQTAQDIIVKNPDILVLIDAQDFTKRVAAKVRKAAPHIPIVLYVSPTVWAWRAGRAKAIKPYIDHILALFPFEPAVLNKLNGPPATYAGHPLLERITWQAKGDKVLLLPGSRRSEIKYLLPLFKEVVAAFPHEKWVIPAVPHLYQSIQAQVHYWPVKPEIVMGEAAKITAFKEAKAAVAASGTVTLELALAQIPHIAAYKGGRIEGAIARQLIRIPSALLPNIILNQQVVPEFMQEKATPANMITALTPLLSPTQERETQLNAFAKLKAEMAVSVPPSQKAAEVILNLLNKRPII